MKNAKHLWHLGTLTFLPVLLLTSLLAAWLVTGAPSAHAACPIIAGYQTFGFDSARASYNVSECIISPTVAPPFNWNTTFSSSTLASRNGISTYKTMGFVGVKNLMTGFLLSTGATVWSFATAGTIVGAATTNSGNVYFGSLDSNFYALNFGGGLICSTPLIAPIESTPAIFKNLAIINDDSGNVYGIDTTTCAIVWRVTLPRPSASSPTVSTGMVYISDPVTATQSVVFVLNAASGGIIGTTPLVNGNLTTPAVANQQIYVGSDNTTASVIDFNAFAPFNIVWTASTAGQPVYGKPAVDNSQVYVTAAASGILFAFNSAIGTTNWIMSSPCGPLYKAAAPTVANGGVYVGTQNCVQAFTTAGTPTWVFSLGGVITSPVTVVNGILLVIASNSMVDRIFSF